VATFVPAPKCVQLTVNGEQVGVPCQFGLGLRFPTEPVLTDLDDLLLLVGNWITTQLTTVLNVDSRVTSMKAQALSSGDGIVKAIELDESGTTTEPMPNQVAVCLTKDTGHAGRSNRGRLYVWGVGSENLANTRTLSLVGLGAYNDVFLSLLTDLAGTDWVPVVISTISAGVPRVTAQITDVFQIVCRDARLDTQRRRLGRSI